MMKKEIIKRTASVVFVGVLALSLLSFAGIIDLQKLTGFAIFEQNDGTGFDEGMYSNVLWDGSSIVLSGDNLTGNYTSKIFDAGNDAIWALVKSYIK